MAVGRALCTKMFNMMLSIKVKQPPNPAIGGRFKCTWIQLPNGGGCSQ